jgi:hypothetical protein
MGCEDWMFPIGEGESHSDESCVEMPTGPTL